MYTQCIQCVRVRVHTLAYILRELIIVNNINNKLKYLLRIPYSLNLTTIMQVHHTPASPRWSFCIDLQQTYEIQKKCAQAI